MNQRGWRSQGDQDPLNQLSKTHINWQRMKQQVQGLHGSALVPLHVSYSIHLSVFMGCPNVWMRLEFLCQLLGIFSFFWVALSKPWCDSFCFIYQKPVFFFLMKGRKEMIVKGKRGREGMARVEGWGTVIKIYFLSKKYFQL